MTLLDTSADLTPKRLSTSMGEAALPAERQGRSLLDAGSRARARGVKTAKLEANQRR